MVMRIAFAIACPGSAHDRVSVQVMRLFARCDVSFPKGFKTISCVAYRAPSPGNFSGRVYGTP